VSLVTDAKDHCAEVGRRKFGLGISDACHSYLIGLDINLIDLIYLNTTISIVSVDDVCIRNVSSRYRAAMEAEALPMVKSLKLVKDDPPVIPPPAPCVSYSGTDWGLEIHLVCFGTQSIF